MAAGIQSAHLVQGLCQLEGLCSQVLGSLALLQRGLRLRGRALAPRPAQRCSRLGRGNRLRIRLPLGKGGADVGSLHKAQLC